MSVVFGALSLAIGIVVLPATAYLGILALLSLWPPRPPAAGKLYRFVVVVPAHNEEAQIAATVQSLRAVDYPPELFAVLVVADNCGDATAARAAAAGARVLERQHATLRGKGYALELAFEHILAAGEAEAVVVVDADTVVAPALLQAFAAQLAAGARAVQGDYGVRNPEASWRTRLMAVALGMFHRARSLGRERLRLSAGLRGNGMCFTCALLREHPHRAFGLVEDVEYGLALGRAGIRVAYADEARVLGEMVSSAAASQSQRARWEGGRMQLVRQQLPGLLASALRRRSWLLADLAMDLAVPPLSYLGLAVVAGLVLEAAHLCCGGAAGAGAALWLASAACLGIYVARGVALSGLGLRAVPALLWAPIYIVWKVLLMLRPGSRAGTWVRTRREGESPGQRK